MLIGYMRVSKADGSQATDLQRDALIAAGVDPAHLYEDQASGQTRGSSRPVELPEGATTGGYVDGVET
jgi:DNA invertase Pin-like site-specific DNA recombinase